MKIFKRLLAMILAVLMVMSMAACSKQDATDGTGQGGADGEKGNYSVSVKSKGGMPMAELDVYVYADNSLADLKDYGKTNADGKVSFNLPKKDGYAVVVSGAPKGYDVKEYYSFSGAAANITLTSSLIKGESLSGATLGLGDVMYDFTVTNADGKEVTLSNMLKEKDVVLLNFWYTTCSWCITEFPIMEEAYQMYKDDVGIIALDPLDAEALIPPFQKDMQLTFDMASCPAAWSASFGVAGYPTTVVIDRYGVICLVESGAITSLRPFMSMFDHFTADDYKQKICENGVSDLVTAVKPTHTMPSTEDISNAVNRGDIQVTYRAEDGAAADVTWPFIIDKKNDQTCLKASNVGVDDSFAIIYADVTLKAGQAIAFDYLISSEQGSDVLVVIVDDEDIYQISGTSQAEEWKSCYPWVATADGTYELALCYLKDESDAEGDDTVYVKNMRIVDQSQIDAVSYIPRNAAVSADGFDYNYVEIFYNQADGYYHVGSVNGPLLLVDMMNYTQFSEEQTLWDICYDGAAKNYYEALEDYFSYASNSSLSGVCTVNSELCELLKKVDEAAGFDSEDNNEWLKLCKYYQVYGSGDAQLQDPIKGLAPFSAYKATLGKNVVSNFFYYDHIIMPRGLLAEFVPSKSGVYRVTSRSESIQGVDGWIFDENHHELLVYEMDERLYSDNTEVSMVYYMEAGKKYYIDIAFWDPYEEGYIYYDIEYIASSYKHFRLASPGYFTYDTNATGDAMYHLIAGGIKPVLGTDGKYYEDLGKDANGNQKYGSLLYADFTGMTSLFSAPIATVPAYDDKGNAVLDANGNPTMVKGMIDLGGFDLSKTEEDLYVISILNKHNGDQAAADAYLREYWGEEYDANAAAYQIKDVFAGRYHGKGQDYTAEMKGYLNKIISTGGAEVRGCVVVDERLAELLQMLMDKYTFENVDHSWIKLCYYYDYLGPQG
ncbi:MAG: TlpA family protein disulfide reductase [Oscillospiraceae bacterium]|nr:TlpA family protein disulfide reductase [Oscillospiraceae bacterium]